MTRPQQPHDQDKPTKREPEQNLQATWDTAMSQLANVVAALETLPSLQEEDDEIEISLEHRAMLAGAAWRLAGIQTRLFAIDVHAQTEAELAQDPNMRDRLDDLAAEADRALEEIDDDATKH